LGRELAIELRVTAKYVNDFLPRRRRSLLPDNLGNNRVADGIPGGRRNGDQQRGEASWRRAEKRHSE
jgi:hypothetical protein